MYKSCLLFSKGLGETLKTMIAIRIHQLFILGKVPMATHLYTRGRERRQIRLIEGNAKYPHLKKWTCKGTLRQVFIYLRPEPHPPPLTH